MAVSEKRYSYKIWQFDGCKEVLDYLRLDKTRLPFITGSIGGRYDAPSIRVLLYEEDVVALKLKFPKLFINRYRKAHIT